MAEYTYSELSQMQKDAIERVQEMRKKAKFAAEDAAQRFGVKQADEDGFSSKQADQNSPKNAPLPNKENTTDGHVHANNRNRYSEVNTGTCCRKKGNKNDLFSKLFGGKGIRVDDPDKALLLSLCFLLQAEKADEELVLALLYLLF